MRLHAALDQGCRPRHAPAVGTALTNPDGRRRRTTSSRSAVATAASSKARATQIENHCVPKDLGRAVSAPAGRRVYDGAEGIRLGSPQRATHEVAHAHNEFKSDLRLS